MSGRWIMMCAGEYHPMKIDIRTGDFVVAVDGGLKYLLSAGIRPDFLLGDLDSMEPELAGIVEAYRQRGGSAFLQLPVEKDDTDTMAAVKLGLMRGYRDFVIYGGLGARLDHTMAFGQGDIDHCDRGRTVYDPGIFLGDRLAVRSRQEADRRDDPRNEI